MPSYQSELTVIVRAKELASYIMTVTDKSPKRFRFTLTLKAAELHTEYYRKSLPGE